MYDRPTIMLVQFRQSQAAARLELASIARSVAPYADIVPVCGVTADIRECVSDFDGVILGGSGDYDFDGARHHDDVVRQETKRILASVAPTLDYIFDTDMPLFGICFGHQLMGAFAGAPVYHDIQQSKTKTHRVILESDGLGHRLCANLPMMFDAQYGHKDVLAHVPSGATLLARGGEACLVSALAYSQRIMSTQFHPELTLADMHERVVHIPHYLPEGKTIDDIYTDTPHAPTLLQNFAQLCMALRMSSVTLKTY